MATTIKLEFYKKEMIQLLERIVATLGGFVADRDSFREVLTNLIEALEAKIWQQ